MFRNSFLFVLHQMHNRCCFNSTVDFLVCEQIDGIVRISEISLVLSFVSFSNEY